ncbi:MAG: sulfotransferase [Rhodoblastus sp.]|nr:sulfotransferase [Rhodoblastus sp.]
MTPVHVFILTYGRTGSTLLQGLLNAHPDVRINGERFGALYDLYRARASLLRSVVVPKEDGPQNPFFGGSAMADGALLASIDATVREIVDLAAAGKRVRGMKEVRYDMLDFDDFVDYLDEVFPDAFFVTLTRPVEDVLTSGFWKNISTEAAARRIRFVEENFERLRRRRPERTIPLTYDDVVSLSERLKHLFASIGVAFDAERAKAVLKTPHSYDQRVFIAYDTTTLHRSPASSWNGLLEFCNIEQSGLEQGRRRIAGVAVPKTASGPLNRVFFRDGGGAVVVEGRAGINSPGVMKRFSGNPFAAKCRFEIDLPEDPGLYDLVATVGSSEIEIARGNVGEAPNAHDRN